MGVMGVDTLIVPLSVILTKLYLNIFFFVGGGANFHTKFSEAH